MSLKRRRTITWENKEAEIFAWWSLVLVPKKKFIIGAQPARNRVIPTIQKRSEKDSPNQPPGHLNLSSVHLPDAREGTPVVKEINGGVHVWGGVGGRKRKIAKSYRYWTYESKLKKIHITQDVPKSICKPYCIYLMRISSPRLSGDKSDKEF